MLNDLISLFYPNNCLCCNGHLKKGEIHLCLVCHSELPKTNYIKEKDNPVSKLFWGRIELSSGHAMFQFGKNGKVQDLIHELKYKGNTNIGEFLGQQMGLEINENDQKYDCIIPVPLHPKKERLRGYNQSLYLAKGIAQATNIPVLEKLLIRTTNTESQTRKSKFQRWENVSSIFNIKNTSALENKHILLIDDVITTGATLESCAMELLKIKNTKVSIAAAAYGV